MLVFNCKIQKIFSACIVVCFAGLLSNCTAVDVTNTKADTSTNNDKKYYLTVLHTNDHHGRFWPNDHGEYGMAARKTLINEIRASVTAAGGHTLVLSGGDINTGVPESDILDAEPDFLGMNSIGYDAMAVGNHEFDNSVETIRKQQLWSDFPFLSANIYDENDDRLFKPYQFFDLNGLQVAVVGFTTHMTGVIGNPLYIEGLEFTLPEMEAAKLIPTLRPKADMVIAVTHMGHTNYDKGNDVTLATNVDGFDLIVGGHSSEPVCVDQNNQLRVDYKAGEPCVPAKINDTYIVQAEIWGKYVGRADFVITIDGAEQTPNKVNSIELTNYELIPVNLKVSREEDSSYVEDYIEPDIELSSLLTEFQSRGAASLNEPVGIATEIFDKDDNSNAPNSSSIGGLIAASFIDFSEADIAVTNDGGIRDNLHKGTITNKHLLQILPFGNTLVYADFTGAELLNYFSAILLLPNNVQKHQFSQIAFVGGELIYTKTNEPLQPEKTYRLATNSYNANGGEGYPKITDKPSYVDTGISIHQVLSDYIVAKEVISPSDY